MGAPRALASERRAAGAGRPVRILLVEDDEDIRLLMTVALRGEGYEVTSVASADEALSAMRSKRHDLVLTDYCLPGKDGLEMLSEAQRIGVLSKAPAILVTAFPPAASSQLTVLAKPVELDELIAQIRRLTNR
jgi:CheY-like chemotaxis protein